MYLLKQTTTNESIMKTLREELKISPEFTEQQINDLFISGAKQNANSMGFKECLVTQEGNTLIFNYYGEFNLKSNRCNAGLALRNKGDLYVNSMNRLEDKITAK